MIDSFILQDGESSQKVVLIIIINGLVQDCSI